MRFCGSGSEHLKKRRKEMESGGFTLMHAGEKNIYECGHKMSFHWEKLQVFQKLNNPNKSKQTNKQMKKGKKKAENDIFLL